MSTTSEGEFKKRLREMVDSGQIIHNEDEIFGGWIDEARKDFPTLKQIEDDFQLNVDEHDAEKTLAIWITLASKRWVWFLKWFGSGDKKDV